MYFSGFGKRDAVKALLPNLFDQMAFMLATNKRAFCSTITQCFCERQASHHMASANFK
jgi:hypothetical protein